GQSYLFNCNNADELLRYYCECYQKVQLNFSPLDSRGKERGFGVNEQAAIRQTIALHWMYFYLVNSLPVELTADDLAHPDTWQFVIIASESKYGRGTPQAIRIAAHVLGTTALQVQNCIDAEEHFSSIW
ncbi:MAG: hypothetical protein K8T91_15360, partial [Planctomycetes bacterium]|nr:hypothetical protein [Planctomycetota bacterium]